MTQLRVFGEGPSVPPTRSGRASRPRLVDLFSCAGGAAMGYHRAGFDVDGCDIADRLNYPFPYHRGDALAYLAAVATSGAAA